MNTERDKHLTEAMGECWYQSNQTYNTNFSTWEGFGKLWEWSQKQEWWEDYINNFENHSLINVNPDRFADTVYTYLKEKT